MKESNKDLIIGILVRHLGYKVLNSRICEIGEEIYSKLCIVNESDVIGVVSKRFSKEEIIRELEECGSLQHAIEWFKSNDC